MVFSWLTWLGLLVAGLGWTAPWFFPAMGDDEIGFLLRYASSPAAMQTIAQNMILSGFGIAILGALQTGFGALNQHLHAAGRPASAELGQVVERGKLQDRQFSRFADGSVEVETLLGTRRFASMADAQGFIGC
jgi:hypothetical protein